MNPIDFIFKLLLRFVPIDEQEYGKMRADASEWYHSINMEQDNLSTKFKKLFLDWRGKLVLAVLFIPASRWLQNIMNPEQFEEDDSEY
jgi:hypothetical protein